MLRQLHTAYSTDKSKSKNDQEQPKGAEPTATLVPLTESEAKELEQEIESGKIDDKVEDRPVSSEDVLRVHGIFMKERREFDIRLNALGKLELWDAKSGEKW